jgi:hypothetical protein
MTEKVTKAFWDPATMTEYHQEVDLRQPFWYKGEMIYIEDLMGRIEKLEDALADFLILGEKDGAR